MTGRIKRFFQRLFCRHDWVKVAVFQEDDPARNERYGIRRYECLKCGRVSHQDSRRDAIGGIGGCPKPRKIH